MTIAVFRGVTRMAKPLDTFLANVPDPTEVRQRIAANLRERQLLRRVLKLAIDRERAIALSRGDGREGATR